MRSGSFFRWGRHHRPRKAQPLRPPLYPLPRETAVDEDPIDLSSAELSHYRLSKLKEQHLLLVRDSQPGIQPASDVGTRKARDKKEEFLSQIISRLNEVFITEGLTDNDLLTYARSVRDKISENKSVMQQIESNSPEQAMLGDFQGALTDAVMEAGDAHSNQMNQIFASEQVAAGFGRIVFDLLVAQMKGQELEGPPSSRRGERREACATCQSEILALEVTWSRK